MSDRIILHFLEDILGAIEAIERFIAQMDYEQFLEDEKTIRAVEREFEIIGEAVKNSGANNPGISNRALESNCWHERSFNSPLLGCGN